MFTILLATTLTCSEADILVSKMMKYNVEEELRTEMISVVKAEADGSCWDAKDD